MSSRSEQLRASVDTALNKLLSRQSPKCVPGFGGLPPLQNHDALNRKRKRWTHPLDFMAAKKLLSYGEYIGGVRFRSDYEGALISGDQTSTWAHVIDGMPFMPRIPKSSECRENVQAIAERAEPIGYKLLVTICCHGMNIGEISSACGAERHWISRRFRDALDVASVFYNSAIDCVDKRD